MKKILTLSILIFCGLQLSAWAASGFEAVGHYEGDTWAILIYYDDSVDWMSEDMNSELPGALRDIGFDVYYSRPISEEELLDIAIDVMTYGSEFEGWDYCVGVVFYYRYGYVYLDTYLLGYGGIPYLYLGTDYYYYTDF